jgi:single-strand DNA-binding protein
MANFNFNKVILGGRLTADPELKTTTSGVSVTTFTLAITRRFGGRNGEERQSDFITVTAWRQTAEFITRFFHKGSNICVVGSLQTRSWIDQNQQKHFVTEVVADEGYFVDSASESGNANGSFQRPAQQNAPLQNAQPAQGMQPAQSDNSGAPAYVPENYGTPAFSSQSSAGANFAPVADDEDLPF